MAIRSGIICLSLLLVSALGILACGEQAPSNEAVQKSVQPDSGASTPSIAKQESGERDTMPQKNPSEVGDLNAPEADANHVRNTRTIEGQAKANSLRSKKRDKAVTMGVQRTSERPAPTLSSQERANIRTKRLNAIK